MVGLREYSIIELPLLAESVFAFARLPIDRSIANVFTSRDQVVTSLVSEEFKMVNSAEEEDKSRH